MTTQALPKRAVEMDAELEAVATNATDRLMEHRWHWTLDESNPKRVSLRTYARSVGRAMSNIQADAKGWQTWLDSEATPSDGVAPGKPTTPHEHRELAKLGSNKQQAVEALAKHRGKSVGSQVHPNKREDVNSVVARAQERAAERGTTVEHEIDKEAEWQAKAEKAAAKERDERKRRHTQRFISIEGHIGSAMRYIRKALDESAEVDFTDDEREIMTDTLGKLRAVLGLLDLRIAGTVDVDWDAELQRIS